MCWILNISNLISAIKSSGFLRAVSATHFSLLPIFATLQPIMFLQSSILILPHSRSVFSLYSGSLLVLSEELELELELVFWELYCSFIFSFISILKFSNWYLYCFWSSS